MMIQLILPRQSTTIDSGHKVFNALTDTFEIHAVWVSDQTGLWDNGSQDETKKYINAMDNGAQKDSATIGHIVVSGNTAQTVISVKNDWYDLNLNGLALESNSNERFTLTNLITGEMRYDGLNPKAMISRGIFAVYSFGGTQIFEFHLLVNGLELPAPDDIHVPLDIGTRVQSLPFTWAASVQPGDLMRLQVRNTEGVSNIVINMLKHIVK